MEGGLLKKAEGHPAWARDGKLNYMQKSEKGVIFKAHKLSKSGLSVVDTESREV